MVFLASGVVAKLPDPENMNFLNVPSGIKKRKLKEKKGNLQSFCKSFIVFIDH